MMNQITELVGEIDTVIVKHPELVVSRLCILAKEILSSADEERRSPACQTTRWRLDFQQALESRNKAASLAKAEKGHRMPTGRANFTQSEIVSSVTSKPK